MELMAKKNLVDSGDLHEAFQKTDRSVFAGLILPYISFRVLRLPLAGGRGPSGSRQAP